MVTTNSLNGARYILCGIFCAVYSMRRMVVVSLSNAWFWRHPELHGFEQKAETTLPLSGAISVLINNHMLHSNISAIYHSDYFDSPHRWRISLDLEFRLLLCP